MSHEGAPAFQRILLKLSGESLMGALDYGTDPERLSAVAEQIKRVHDRGVEIAIVLGAGNIYRGIAGAAPGMDRATADYMGMLAIVLNALPLQDALEKLGVHTRVQSAIHVRRSPSPTSAAARCATSRRAASSSSPPAPATRSSPPTPRPRCGPSRSTPRSILMAKNGVEGVYTADPREDPDGGVHRRDHPHGGGRARACGSWTSRR